MSFITNDKANLKYILIVAVLAAIVGGGILAWCYWWMPEQGNIMPPEKITEEPSEEAKDETADWHTFKSEEYKFELKYPKLWHAYHNTKLGFAAISTFSQDKYEEYFGKEDEGKLGENYGLIHIDYIENRSFDEISESAKKIIEDTAENPTPSFKIEEYAGQQINVDGSRGYGIYYRASYPTQTYYEGGIYAIYLVLDKNGKGVIGFEGKFIGKDKEIYKEYAKIFVQIFSTFKFLE